MMFKKLLILSLFVLFFAVLLVYQGCQKSVINTSLSNQAVNNQPDASTVCPKPTEGFPSFMTQYAPPEWYCKQSSDEAKKAKFPIFQLSQNYPTETFLPCNETDCPWTKYNFQTQWKEYLEEVLKYAYKDNVEKDWVNPQGWYNAPYMHLDTFNQVNGKDAVGREFMRGMTVERTSCREELNWNPESKKDCLSEGIHQICDGDKNDNCFASWAISFYNARGGLYINEVWKDVQDNQQLDNYHGGFPDGTVAIKFLFTDATPNDAKYLKDSIEWQADILRSKKKLYLEENCLKDNAPSEECYPKVRLLQVDIAVRDDRKDELGNALAPTGWVFGTYTYNLNAKKEIEYTFNETLSAAEKEKKRGWLRLEPVGLMFGNEMKSNAQSMINTDITQVQHLGCEGRLNGPVDNPNSSCLSCHALSETPKNLAVGSVRYGDIAGSCKDDASIAHWFRNINPRSQNNQTFTQKPKPVSLDYSLQLREGIFRYCIEQVDKDKLNKCVGKTSGGKIERLIEILTRSGTKSIPSS